jgi:hypothetical protein
MKTHTTYTQTQKVTYCGGVLVLITKQTETEKYYTVIFQKAESDLSEVFSAKMYKRLPAYVKTAFAY